MANRQAVGCEPEEVREAGFSAEERAAMKQRAAELKTAVRGKKADKTAADLEAVLSIIADMPASDRALAERIHALVTAAATELAPRLWYGQPACALTPGLAVAGEAAIRARIESAVGA